MKLAQLFNIVPRGGGGYEAHGMLGRTLLAKLPEICEFHLHTSTMLDEASAAVAAGNRKLGVALESISLTPLLPPE